MTRGLTTRARFGMLLLLAAASVLLKPTDASALDGGGCNTFCWHNCAIEGAWYRPWEQASPAMWRHLSRRWIKTIDCYGGAT
jgi:hypothetical protein